MDAPASFQLVCSFCFTLYVPYRYCKNDGMFLPLPPEEVPITTQYPNFISLMYRVNKYVFLAIRVSAKRIHSAELWPTSTCTRKRMQSMVSFLFFLIFGNTCNIHSVDRHLVRFQFHSASSVCKGASYQTLSSLDSQSQCPIPDAKLQRKKKARGRHPTLQYKMIVILCIQRENTTQ